MQKSTVTGRNLLRGPRQRTAAVADPRLFIELGDVAGPDRGAVENTTELVLWDMRGHGRSDYPDDASAL